MAGVAPAFTKLVQQPGEAAPIVVKRGLVGVGPGTQFFDQRQALGARLGGLQLEIFEPRLDHLVRLVAGLVKALPHGMVWHPTLVGLLPLLAQGAQRLLHLSAADRLSRGPRQKRLGTSDQFLAQLVGAPTLPALQLAGCRQRCVGLVLQPIIYQAPGVFERTAQRCGGAGASLAMALGDLGFELGQHRTHGSACLGAQFGVHLRLLRLGRRIRGNAACLAQFVGPDRDRWQGRSRFAGGRHRLGQRRLKCLPDCQQLSPRCFQQRRKFQVDAGPVGISQQGGRLRLPMRHIAAQSLPDRLRSDPGLGREHLDALGQQDRRFALHLHPMLQVLNHAHPVG